MLLSHLSPLASADKRWKAAAVDILVHISLTHPWTAQTRGQQIPSQRHWPDRTVRMLIAQAARRDEASARSAAVALLGGAGAAAPSLAAAEPARTSAQKKKEAAKARTKWNKAAELTAVAAAAAARQRQRHRHRRTCSSRPRSCFCAHRCHQLCSAGQRPTQIAWRRLTMGLGRAA